jgi:hypothetical protein
MAKEDNEMVQTKDQTSENPYVRAMRKNMEEKVPLVLILGKQAISILICGYLVADSSWQGGTTRNVPQ